MINNLASQFNYLLVEFICREVFVEIWDAKQFGKHVFKTAINNKIIEGIHNQHYICKLLFSTCADQQTDIQTYRQTDRQTYVIGFRKTDPNCTIGVSRITNLKYLSHCESPLLGCSHTNFTVQLEQLFSQCFLTIDVSQLTLLGFEQLFSQWL